MFVLIIILICYAAVMISLIYGWQKIPEFSLGRGLAVIRFTVIVPFRNEADNLPDLLTSLAGLKYPASKFEIIFVNDDSDDHGVKIITAFQQVHPHLHIKILTNKRVSNSPKKDAITSAIKSAEFEYIITTDADCQVPVNWLKSFNDFILSTGNKFVAAPVSLSSSSTQPPKQRSWSEHFEELDILSLQGSTTGAFGIGKAFMCNGANLCYKKSSFLELKGYTDNNQIASGDDVFLLQKFQQKQYKHGFLKCRKAVVQTRTQPGFKHLVSQRVRWASKAPAYQSWFSKLTGLSVLGLNFSLVIAAILVLFQLLAYSSILIMVSIKFLLDFILIYRSAKFFNRISLMRSFLWSSIFYPFFSTYIAYKCLFSEFYWKGRLFKK